MADDFYKEFTLQQEEYMIENKKTKHHNKPNRMSGAEIMVIPILFHSGGFHCFKHYYKKLFANIWNTFSRIRFPITVLCNWRRKYYFP